MNNGLRRYGIKRTAAGCRRMAILNLRSPKSKEGCRVTKKQALWLCNIIRQQPGLKNYCMIKRLVLYATTNRN